MGYPSPISTSWKSISEKSTRLREYGSTKKNCETKLGLGCRAALLQRALSKAIVKKKKSPEGRRRISGYKERKERMRGLGKFTQGPKGELASRNGSVG